MNSTRTVVRALRGPVLLMALGLLFVLDYWGAYPVYKTWPILLIVFGAMKLMEKLPGADLEDGTQTPAGGAA